MKKLWILGFCLLGLVGCGKKTTVDNLIESLGEKIEEIDEYHVKATMNIKRNDNQIIYDVSIDYKDDNYAVKLVSRENNNAQIILKNQDGVFVLNPAVNKCFKFNSNWPGNSSNGYLFDTIVKDIVNDTNRVLTSDGDNYYVESKVNHKTNANWVSQKVTIDKDSLMPKEVLIYNGNKEVIISVIFEKFDLSPKLSSDNFNQEKLMTTAILELGEGPVSSSPSSFINPTYVPDGYSLDLASNDDVLKTSSYIGESPFIITQQICTQFEDTKYVKVYGDLVLLDVGVASLSDSCLTWINEKTEYVIFSTTLDVVEMINVANSFVNIDE